MNAYSNKNKNLLRGVTINQGLLKNEKFKQVLFLNEFIIFLLLA